MGETIVQPYLFFGGRCEEAIAFYKTAVGAEILMMMRAKEAPEGHIPENPPAGWEERIMHASFRIGESTIMAADGCENAPAFQGFALSYTAPDEAAAHRAFNALAEGGQIRMPLGKTFWSPCFGMLEDRFGLGWMVTVES